MQYESHFDENWYFYNTKFIIINSRLNFRLFNDSNIFKHHLLTMERKAHLTKLTQRAEHFFQKLISVKNTIKCTKLHYSLYTTLNMLNLKSNWKNIKMLSTYILILYHSLALNLYSKICYIVLILKTSNVSLKN